MKQFMYFESTEGGMEAYTFSGVDDFDKPYGWMSDHCEEWDKALIEFIVNAEIGDVRDHRLGYCVRLKDCGD